MTLVPTYAFEVAWSDRLTGVFRIGTSTIGGSDVIAGGFGANTFDDITTDVKDITIKRGRNDGLGRMQQGRCTIRLNDSTGKYNPENSSSELYGKLEAMRPVRLRATYDGTVYTRLFGYVSEIWHDPDKAVKESVIEAVDFFEWLQHFKPTIDTQTNATISTIIGLILDAVGLTSAKMRNLEAGGSVIPSWSADGSRSALALIEDLLLTDQGLFFLAGDGRVTYITRATLWRAGVSAATTFTTAQVGSLRTGVSVSQIINSQSVTRAGGSTQTASDAASQRKFGYREGPAIEFAYGASDTEMHSLAGFIVALNKQHRPPARQVKLSNKDATDLVQILTREIGDYVTVNETAGGTNFSGHIQAIEERIVGKTHSVAYSVQKKPLTFFTIGTSTIGSNHIIGY